jgi:histidinol phosphatase-like PHP family hydrolase
LGILLELRGDSVFKIRAYQRAARTISHLSFPLVQAVEDGIDLKPIPCIGKAISNLHSDWSDGRDPIETMVSAVAAQGYEYMALTGHSSGRGIANGLSPQHLLDQIGLLRSLQGEYPITILCGSEVDIRADGTPDYPDELLEKLDVVVASVHSAMGQDSHTMTQRIMKAMRHPAVTIIGYLSTRLLGRREPIKFDLEAVLQQAQATGAALEINSSPERLDLKDAHATYIRTPKPHCATVFQAAQAGAC